MLRPGRTDQSDWSGFSRKGETGAETETDS